MALKKLYSIIFTLLMVAIALILARLLWLHYMHDPWTRDARVRADVIEIAPDVSGFVTELRISDNQEVKQGDLLFNIDPARYRIAVKQMESEVAARKVDMELQLTEARRRADADSLVVSKESRNQAESAAKIAEATYQQALARLATAKLDLERTAVRAPADGYITNLNLHKGDYLQAGHAAVALIDKHSFWVYGYFEETKLPLVKPGDKANIILMDGSHLTGHVSSIARGIYDNDNPDSDALIANVRPTFDWVRLARRIPVHVALDNVPEDQVLAMGTTCSVVLDNAAARRHWWALF